MFSVWLSLAMGQTCAPTSVGQLAAEASPAVYVLGERKGMPADPGRAYRLVKKLAQRGPVRLVVQAVPVGQQAVLDDWAAGKLPDELLIQRLGIAESWGFSGEPYRRLVMAEKALGVDVVAGGVPVEVPAADAIVPQPSGYIHVLAETMSGAAVPVGLEGRFLSTVAWIDHRVAARALDGWTGEGALVVVADRLHVEGAKGIGWQLERMQPAPVHNVLLKRSDTPCYAGDLTLR